MARLPDGWESDYDGTRWLYRYKANGHVQYHFPQPGDEYAEFFLDDGSGPLELSPEESLAIERQAKQRSGKESETETVANMKTSGSKRDKRGINAIEEEDGNGMSATGYFDPSSFMFPGGYNDFSPMDNDSPRLDSASTVSTANTHPAAAELPEGDRQLWSPIGFVAELATQDTLKCAEELAPVELDAASFAPASIPTHIPPNGPAELPTHQSPLEEKAPELKTTRPAAEPVSSYPLVSASFAYAPPKDSNLTSQGVPPTGQAMIGKTSQYLPSMKNGQNKYHPWVPTHGVAQPEVQTPERSSGILAQTTVLENQNSELGGIERENSSEDARNANLVDVPSALAPALGPKAPNPTPSTLTTQHPAGLQLSQGSQQRPLPGTAARHESISINPQGFACAPSILEPDGRKQSTNLAGPIKLNNVELKHPDSQDVVSMPSHDRFHTQGLYGRPGPTRVNTMPNDLSSNDLTLPPQKPGGPGFLFFHEISSTSSLASPDGANMSQSYMPSKPETQGNAQFTNSSSRPSSQTHFNMCEAYPGIAPLKFMKRHSSKGSQHSSHVSESLDSASSLDKPSSMSFDDISEAISVISNDFTPHGTPAPVSSPSRPPPHAQLEASSIQSTGEGPAGNTPLPGTGLNTQPTGQASSPSQPDHSNAAAGNFISAPGLNSSPAMTGSGEVVTASSLIRPQSTCSDPVTQITPGRLQPSSTPHTSSQSSQHTVHHGISHHPAMQTQPEHNGPTAAHASVSGQPSSHSGTDDTQGPSYDETGAQASMQPLGQSSQGETSTVESYDHLNGQNTQSTTATAYLGSAAVRPQSGQQIQNPGLNHISPQLQQPSPITLPVSPLQSQVSSPAQSILSLHMSQPLPQSSSGQTNINATMDPNIGASINTSQVESTMHRPSSVPPHLIEQQVAGNLPPTNTHTQRPPSDGSSVVGQPSSTQTSTPASPPKPYPMLPGQVTPLPSQPQIGISHRPPRKPVASQVAGGSQHNSQVANSPEQVGVGQHSAFSQSQYQPVLNYSPTHPALSQQRPNYQQTATATQASGSQSSQLPSATTTPAPSQQTFAAPPAAQGQQPVQSPTTSSPTFQYAGKPFNSAQTTAALKDAGKGMKKWGKKMLKSPAVQQATAAISGALISESVGGSAGGGAAIGSKIYSTFQQRPQVAHAQTAPPQTHGIPQQPVPSLTQPSQVPSQVPGQMPVQMQPMQFQQSQSSKPGQVLAVQGQVLPQHPVIPQPGQLPVVQPSSIAAQPGMPQPNQQAGHPQFAHMQPMQTTFGQHQHQQPHSNYSQSGHPQPAKPQAGPQPMPATQPGQHLNTQPGYHQAQQQQQVHIQGNQQQPQPQQVQPQLGHLPFQYVPSQQTHHQQSQPVQHQISQSGYPQPGKIQPAQIQPGPPHQIPAQPLNPPITAPQLAAQPIYSQMGQPAGVQTPGRPPVVQNPALASGVAANFTAQAQANGNVQQQYPMQTQMAGPMIGQPPMTQLQQERPGATIGVDSNGGLTAQTQTNMNPGLVLGTAFLGNVINNAIRTHNTAGNNQENSLGNSHAHNESHGGGYESHGAAHDANGHGSYQESYFGQQQQPASYADQTYPTDNTTYVNNTTYVVDNSTTVNTDYTYATDVNMNTSVDMNSVAYADTSMTSFDTVQAVNITSTSDWTSSGDYSGGGWGDYEF
ncbi:hypothetical protein F5Y18DRAFT_359889 [Xylariaceae sp. FL1019]|nr:hypothetical protein F5Y18DRAFT_359889 [Xylariaceae sp. FL1019]